MNELTPQSFSFKDRFKIAKAYHEWAKENNVKDCALSVITYLYVMGYLDAEKMWIPYKDKKPKKSGSYIVSGVWASGKEVVGEAEYSTADGYFDVAWGFDVTAWMPMPEPYKDDGDAQGTHNKNIEPKYVVFGFKEVDNE